MISHYFKSAWRTATRQPFYSLINVLGLALGMAVCVLIFQYVAYERSYDDFIPEAENVFRITTAYADVGKEPENFATSFPALAPALKTDLPEVQAAARLRHPFGPETSILAERFKGKETAVFYADPSFFEILGQPLSPAILSSFSQPNTALISESSARKYFGESDPIGQHFEMLDDFVKIDFQVIGVYPDIPQNSHMDAQFLLSIKTLTTIEFLDDMDQDWNGFGNVITYIRLKKGAKSELVAAKIPDLVLQHNPKWAELPNPHQLSLQPVQDIHLHSDLNYEFKSNGNASQVDFFLLIGIGLLIIAWINYINLSTARAIPRSGEVGVRKVVGANREQLIAQFLTESLMINGLATGLALTLVQFSLPEFRAFTGLELPGMTGFWWLFMLGIFVVGSVISGIYPAFVLSSFSPAITLKGGIEKIGNSSLRKALVVVQFAASVALIMGTYTVYQQLQFMRSRELGYNPDQVLVINGPAVKTQTAFERLEDSIQLHRIDYFKSKATLMAGVKYFASIDGLPGDILSKGSPPIKRRDGIGEATIIPYVVADKDYLNVFELELIAGKYFDTQSMNQRTVVLNERAVNVLGFDSPEAALNQQITNDWEGKEFRTIIGVVKDYQHQSFKEKAAPIRLILYRPEEIPTYEYYAKYALKVQPEQLPNLIPELSAIYQEIFPDNPFTYFFMDEHFDAQYQADQRFGEIFGLFAGVAIFIACLGLLGLSAYSAVRKTKEIGIRKVLGASVADIFKLLLNEFAVLLLISFLIAVPLSTIGILKWLENYPYKIEIGGMLFFVPILLVVILAALTVSFQTRKAAHANPVDALREN